jgi:hypothetical protein
MTEVAGVERLLTEVASRDDSHTLPQVLLAARHISMGGQARTGLRARHASRNQFAVFHDHLRRAEQLLIEVVAREPANAMAWALRVTTAMGLELGQSEARRRYDRLAASYPSLQRAGEVTSAALSQVERILGRNAPVFP